MTVSIFLLFCFCVYSCLSLDSFWAVQNQETCSNDQQHSSKYSTVRVCFVYTASGGLSGSGSGSGSFREPRERRWFHVALQTDSYLGSLPDRLVSQPAGAHGDELIDQVEQEADGLAAALRPAHPGDLVPADALPVDARDGACQPAVLQRSGAVHLLDLLQHGAPGHLSQETVHIAEAVSLQSRDEPLQSQTLQVRVRDVLDERHVTGGGDVGHG